MVAIGAYTILTVFLALKKDFYMKLRPYNSIITISLVVIVTHVQIKMNLLLTFLYLLAIYCVLPLLLIAQTQNMKWR